MPHLDGLLLRLEDDPLPRAVDASLDALLDTAAGLVGNAGAAFSYGCADGAEETYEGGTDPGVIPGALLAMATRHAVRSFAPLARRMRLAGVVVVVDDGHASVWTPACRHLLACRDRGSVQVGGMRAGLLRLAAGLPDGFDAVHDRVAIQGVSAHARLASARTAVVCDMTLAAPDWSATVLAGVRSPRLRVLREGPAALALAGDVDGMDPALGVAWSPEAIAAAAVGDQPACALAVRLGAAAAAAWASARDGCVVPDPMPAHVHLPMEPVFPVPAHALHALTRAGLVRRSGASGDPRWTAVGCP